MIFVGNDIALNDDDFAISPTGDIDIIGGDANIIQTAINNMRTVYGEWFIDSNMGNEIFSARVKNIKNSIAEVERCCKSAILYDNRISSVSKFSMRVIGPYECIVDFTIEKVDGSTVSSNSVLNIGGAE